jgi:four helix bundle protein
VTKKFPKTEKYYLTSQIQRSAISIPANIAEGFERQHKKECLQHSFIAKGTLGEIETYLLLALNLGYLSKEDYEFLEKKRKETAKVLVGLIGSFSQYLILKLKVLNWRLATGNWKLN